MYLKTRTVKELAKDIAFDLNSEVERYSLAEITRFIGKVFEQLNLTSTYVTLEKCIKLCDGVGKLPCGFIQASSVHVNGIRLPESETGRISQTTERNHVFYTANNHIFVTSSDLYDELLLNYRSFPTDDKGDLLVPESQEFIEVVSAYIDSKKAHKDYYDNKIRWQEYNQVKQGYHNSMNRAITIFGKPTVAQVQVVATMFNNALLNTNSFDNSFASITNRYKV